MHNHHACTPTKGKSGQVRQARAGRFGRALGALRCAKVGRGAAWGAWADGATCARLVVGRVAVAERDRRARAQRWECTEAFKRCGVEILGKVNFYCLDEIPAR